MGDKPEELLARDIGVEQAAQSCLTLFAVAPLALTANEEARRAHAPADTPAATGEGLFDSPEERSTPWPPAALGQMMRDGANG